MTGCFADAPHGMILAMSLATRCTACGTMFGSSRTSSRSPGGWVRCGRCNEVFNAFEHSSTWRRHRDSWRSGMRG